MEEQCSTREPQQPFFEKVYQIRKTTFDDVRVDLIGERNLNELGNSIAVDFFSKVVKGRRRPSTASTSRA